MFTSKVCTDDCRLPQESSLASRQPYMAPHQAMQATKSEGLAKGPYVAARGEVGPAILRAEGTEHHHSATTPLCGTAQYIMNNFINYRLTFRM